MILKTVATISGDFNFSLWSAFMMQFRFSPKPLRSQAAEHCSMSTAQ